MSNLGCNGNLDKADVWNGIKQYAHAHTKSDQLPTEVKAVKL